jgi:hypothetical protein
VVAADEHEQQGAEEYQQLAHRRAQGRDDGLADRRRRHFDRKRLAVAEVGPDELLEPLRRLQRLDDEHQPLFQRPADLRRLVDPVGDRRGQQRRRADQYEGQQHDQEERRRDRRNAPAAEAIRRRTHRQRHHQGGKDRHRDLADRLQRARHQDDRHGNDGELADPAPGNRVAWNVAVHGWLPVPLCTE